MTALVLRLFKFFFFMFMVELLGKIIYLCNKSLLEKLLLRIFRKHLHLWIFRALILTHCMNHLEHWSCVKTFSVSSNSSFKNLGMQTLRALKVKPYDYSTCYFGVMMWVKMYMVIFISRFLMNFKILIFCYYLLVKCPRKIRCC